MTLYFFALFFSSFNSLFRMSIMAEIIFAWRLECVSWDDESEFNRIVFLAVEIDTLWKPLIHHVNSAQDFGAVTT